MPLYHAPTADFQFLLKDWLGLDAHYQKLGIGDFDSELASEIIAQGNSFCHGSFANSIFYYLSARKSQWIVNFCHLSLKFIKYILTCVLSIVRLF